MYKLLKIGDTEFFTPREFDFKVSKADKTNEYETEDGSTTVELIRTGMISGSCSYSSIFADKIAEYDALLKPVTTLTILDPFTNKEKEITAKITGKSVGKMAHENNVSLWSYSFNFDEL